MRELREDTFFENKNEDAHDHVDQVLTLWIDSLQELSTLGTSLKSLYLKKLKENVHAIQVGCQICEGSYLDKECPLNEEVKQAEEVKYGEFGHRTPSTEVMESSFMTTNRAPSTSTGQCRVVNVDHETPNIPISSSKLNNLHIVSLLSDSDSQNSHDNKPKPRDYTFREWMIVKVGHTNVNELVKKALLKSWVIDYFEEALNPDKDPMERSFDDYKWVFDLEIEQLADEYELGI
uniref:Uncharacterized protein n=1 Tax=Tanacetum cinerariifolium TaxID=118510 RepID=A0A6L2LGG9_TANCI|nr:hypothetical protein [Tanacetum cinerariifolium]